MMIGVCMETYHETPDKKCNFGTNNAVVSATSLNVYLIPNFEPKNRIFGFCGKRAS